MIEPQDEKELRQQRYRFFKKLLTCQRVICLVAFAISLARCEYELMCAWLVALLALGSAREEHQEAEKQYQRAVAERDKRERIEKEYWETKKSLMAEKKRIGSS